MKGINGAFRKRNSVNLLPLQLKKRISICKHRNSLKIGNNDQVQLLSDADLQVKNIISDLLVSIDPEEQKKFEIESKLKLIQKSTTTKLTKFEGDNEQNEENNYWCRNFLSNKSSKAKKRDSINGKIKFDKSQKLPMPRRMSYFNNNLAIKNIKEGKSPKNALKKKNNTGFLGNSNTYNLPSIHINPIEKIETQTFNNYKLNKISGTQTFKIKDNVSSLIPVFPNDNGDEGFISYSKNNLITFQTMCSELKKQLTSETFNEANNKKELINISSEESIGSAEKIVDEESGNKAEQQKEKENVFFQSEQDKIYNEEKEKRARMLFKNKSLIYDSLSDNEDITYQIDTFYIFPKSYIKIILDSTIAVATLIFIIVSPIEIAFIHALEGGYSVYMCTINIFWDVVFLIDFIFGFFVAYYDRNDELVTDIKQINRHYLNTWFMLDFITAIPVGSLIDICLLMNKDTFFYKCSYKIFTNYTNVLIHLFKLIKIFKILKVSVNNYLVHEIIHRMIESFVGNQLILYISLLIFVISIHILSCIFVFIGYNQYPNWIIHYGLEPKNYNEIYVTSIYFLCLTIFGIGYGDVLSTNLPEKIYNIFLLIIGLMLYSWLVSALSQIKDQHELPRLDVISARELQKRFTILDIIRNEHPNLSFELFHKIQRYLYYKYEKEQCDLRLIFENLPSNLQKTLLFEIYKPVVNNFIFFKNYQNEDFILKVLKSFIPNIYDKKERIVNAGDFMEEMYFVKKGKLAIELPLPSILSEQMQKTRYMRRIAVTINPKNIMQFINENKKKKKPKDEDKEKYVKLLDIRTNEHYGDIIMFLNQRSPLSVRVNSKKVELLCLKKTDVIEISMSFPTIWRSLITKSVYNMKQIQKLIQKTLHFFYNNNQKVLEVLSQKYFLSFLASQAKEEKTVQQIEKKGTIKEKSLKSDTLESLPNSTTHLFTDNSDNLNSMSITNLKQNLGSGNHESNIFLLKSNYIKDTIDFNSSPNIKSNTLEPNVEKKIPLINHFTNTEDFLMSLPKINTGSYFSSSSEEDSDSSGIKAVFHSGESIDSINNELYEGEKMKVCPDTSQIPSELDFSFFQNYPQSDKNFIFSEDSTKTKIEMSKHTFDTIETTNTINFQFYGIEKKPSKKEQRFSHSPFLLKKQTFDFSKKKMSTHELIRQGESKYKSKKHLSTQKVLKISNNNVLNIITNNIEQSFQKLNNPEEFYSNAFFKIKNEEEDIIINKKIEKKIDDIFSLLKHM